MSIQLFSTAVAALSLQMTPQASLLPPVIPKTISSMVLPGRHSTRLEDLDPEFRAQVKELIQRLEARGFTVRIESTYRSSARQDFLYDVSNLNNRMGFDARFTNVPGGRSCHNHVDENGEPASLAVDLWAYPYGPGLKHFPHRLEQHAEFFEALKIETRQLGLEWGGTYGPRRAPWQEYGMGWDPAHVSDSRC